MCSIEKTSSSLVTRKLLSRDAGVGKAAVGELKHLAPQSLHTLLVSALFELQPALL